MYLGSGEPACSIFTTFPGFCDSSGLSINQSQSGWLFWSYPTSTFIIIPWEVLSKVLGNVLRYVKFYDQDKKKTVGLKIFGVSTVGSLWPGYLKISITGESCQSTSNLFMRTLDNSISFRDKF